MTRRVHRHVLLWSLVLLGVMFAVTATLARAYHAKEEAAVQEWSHNGDLDMQAGHPAAAVDDFRNALSYAPDDRGIQFRLAQALLAEGRLTEAREYFLNLWDRVPGSGEVNLELARISVRTGDSEDAIRYYRSAVFGSWDADPPGHRRQVRRELAEFLITLGRMNVAQAELVRLADDTPADDASLHEQVGRLLVRAGDPARAIREFESALRTDPRRADWWEEAGDAAIEVDDFQRAERFLSGSARLSPSRQTEDLLETVREIPQVDPFRPGLTDAGQAERTARAFRAALARLQACEEKTGATASTTLAAAAADAKSLQEKLKHRSLRAEPELQHEIMDLVFRIEIAAADACGPSPGVDQALVLIGKKHQGNEQ